MAKCLAVWELGGGLGHVTTLAPLLEEISRQGHEIVVAMRDIVKARRVFTSFDASFYQAPFKLSFDQRPSVASSYADILGANGFGDFAELAVLTSAWRNILRHERPDVILFNHSPTALLASRGMTSRRIVIGAGFEIPPDEPQFPLLRDDRTVAEDMVAREGEMLGTTNLVLQSWNGAELPSLPSLYGDVDDVVLTTYPELDPYGSVGRPDYVGVWPNPPAAKPDWPDVPGQRIYAYLKRSPKLRELLHELRQLAQPTLAYFDGDVSRAREQFASDTLRFADKPLDLDAVGRECDVAILSGGHGTTCSMLLAGKPMLFVPQFLEQMLTARRVFDMGAGLVADPNSPSHFREQLQLLLKNNQLRRNASRFADQNHPCHDMDAIVDRVLSGLKSA